MIDNTKLPCKHCGSYDEEMHNPLCIVIENNPKVLKKYLEQYYKAWIISQEHNQKLLKFLKEKITFWQGKYHIVKHENNQLRKKLHY